MFPDVEVRFIADIDEPRAAAQAEKWGVAGSGSVEQLLADDDIEIVVNLTIPAAHVEVALQALAAGKHVWGRSPTPSTARALHSSATRPQRPARRSASRRTPSSAPACRPRSGRSARVASARRSTA